MLCSQRHAPTYVVCMVPKAYCTYRPDVNGNPTFCNDGPYSNYGLTLIARGQDWSDLDGECLVAIGNIEIYKGLPEIEATDRSQV